MDSDQYEELCRLFVAEQLAVPAQDVRSVRIPNPKRPDLPQYDHQIDLYWETGDAIAAYLNIANAKWRGTSKVDQGDVLLLQQVRQQVAAHKAIMITNVGFTAGAIAAAKDHRIALHVVTPTFDVAALPRGNRIAIAEKLHDISSQTASPLYSHRVEHRALESGDAPTNPRPIARPATAPNSGGYETRVIQPAPRLVGGPSGSSSIGGRETRGSFGPRSDTRGGGGLVKK